MMKKRKAERSNKEQLQAIHQFLIENGHSETAKSLLQEANINGAISNSPADQDLLLSVHRFLTDEGFSQSAICLVNEARMETSLLKKSCINLSEHGESEPCNAEKRVIDHANSHAHQESVNVAPTSQKPGKNTILLFYTYCIPQMTRSEQDSAITFCYSTLNKNKVTGRLRVAREGFNGTLTGPTDGVKNFTAAIREQYPHIFGETDFKYVDGQQDNQLLKGLKVWPVTEIVTYGFDPKQAPLDMRGVHLPPKEFHAALANPNSVVIDVRNFNETVIGKFSPPCGDPDAEKVLDPCMRRSTEFPTWVKENKHKLEGKQVLMYCTGGVRCERASAFMRFQGVENVYQLEGGIHRYLESFPDDGGYWVGKNYTFDKRFSHGAKQAEVISTCVSCALPWDRYQAEKKCQVCAMEVLVCRTCQRAKPPVPKEKLVCPLCKPAKN